MYSIAERQRKKKKRIKYQAPALSGMSSNSTISTAEIRSVVERLKSQCYRDSTRKTYYGIWHLFGHFFVRLDDKLTTWEDRIVLFSGFLISNQLKSATVKTYISAIRSVLAEDGHFVQKDSYLLTSLTKACQLQNDVVINRFPIHKGLLHLILNETEKLFNQQPYLEILYKALFISAYYGLLRAGEVTQGPHVILANNVHIGLNKDKILFILRTSKTHTAGSKPQMIKFNRIKAVAKPLNSPSA